MDETAHIKKARLGDAAAYEKLVRLYQKRSIFDRSDEGKIEDSPLFQPLLQKVSPQERAVLILKFNEGYRAAEIGQLLGCSEVTVRVHLFNAKRKLKRELRKSTPTRLDGETDEEVT